MEKTQKEYYLNEQIAGDPEGARERDGVQERDPELEERSRNKKMSKEAHTRFVKS